MCKPLCFVCRTGLNLEDLGERNHTLPCSSAELFFAEKRGPQRRDFSGRYGFPGFYRGFCIHHRPGKFSLKARKGLQKIIFRWWCTFFSSLKSHPWTNASLGRDFRQACSVIDPYRLFLKTRHQGSGRVRPRQGTEICNFGAPSPLHLCLSSLQWIFCPYLQVYCVI